MHKDKISAGRGGIDRLQDERKRRAFSGRLRSRRGPPMRTTQQLILWISLRNQDLRGVCLSRFLSYPALPGPTF